MWHRELCPALGGTQEDGSPRGSVAFGPLSHRGTHGAGLGRGPHITAHPSSSRCTLLQGDTSMPSAVPWCLGTRWQRSGCWRRGEVRTPPPAPHSSSSCCGWSHGVEVTRGDTAAPKAAVRTMGALIGDAGGPTLTAGLGASMGRVGTSHGNVRDISEQNEGTGRVGMGRHLR